MQRLPEKTKNGELGLVCCLSLCVFPRQATPEKKLRNADIAIAGYQNVLKKIEHAVSGCPILCSEFVSGDPGVVEKGAARH